MGKPVSGDVAVEGASGAGGRTVGRPDEGCGAVTGGLGWLVVVDARTRVVVVVLRGRVVLVVDGVMGVVDVVVDGGLIVST
jgi:hypothetical protein